MSVCHNHGALIYWVRKIIYLLRICLIIVKFILSYIYTINYIQWTRTKCSWIWFSSHFYEKMLYLSSSVFVLVLFLVFFLFFSLIAYQKSTQNLCQPTIINPPPPQKKERKHQIKRQKQRNITITWQSSLNTMKYKSMLVHNVLCTLVMGIIFGPWLPDYVYF